LSAGVRRSRTGDIKQYYKIIIAEAAAQVLIIFFAAANGPEFTPETFNDFNLTFTRPFISL
jgi:hypothetical protein